MKTTNKILNQYEVISQIGHGGMGAIYKAYDPILNREVMIELTFNPSESFLRGVKVVAQLNHPNILPIYDVGTEDDKCYVIMRCVDGISLARMIRTTGPISPLTRVLQFIEQIASALDYAHQMKVIHHDLKPGVLLCEKNDWVLVSDFVFEMIGGDDVVFFTPGYASPETILRSHKIDHRSDIYSLGAVLYEMITGQPPYQGDPIEDTLSRAKGNKTLTPPSTLRPDLPAQLDRVVIKALATSPENRYSAASELAKALRESVSLSTGFIGQTLGKYKVTELISLPKQEVTSAIKESSSSRIPILFMASDPTDGARLRLGEELREIQEKLQLAKQRERFELFQRMSVRPADVSQALLDIQPKIVHFSGHGTSTGELCFENQIGKIHPVHPDALAALFEQFASQVNCVLLNACFSETQAKAIAKHIEYVIGMKQAIGDRAAITFTIGFYQALGAGRTIEDAYKLGCVQIRLQGIPEHLIPVLIKKGQTRP